MTVIVTSGGNRIAYNIVRSLGQKGIPVHPCDFTRFSMSFCSRYSHTHFVYPSPYSHPQEFIECIIKQIHSLNASVLLPVFEETYLISKHKHLLEEHVKLAIPDYSKILVAHNKDRWAATAKELNIPIPKTYDLHEIINNVKVVDHLHFPALIKPKQGGGGWGIQMISSPDELKDLLAAEQYHDLPWRRFLVQEIIPGRTHCVAMLFCQGELRAKVGYEQLRDFPIGAGQATMRVSIRNEQAETYLETLLKHLVWHGVCQADFVVDKDSGIPYLVDINPRFWGSLVQGIASGVDFPYLAYRMALDGDVNPVKDFKTGVLTRWLGGDLRAFFPYLMRSKNKLKFIHDFVLPAKAKVYYDDISAHDPVPFFCWGSDSLLRIIKARSLTPAPHDSLRGIWE